MMGRRETDHLVNGLDDGQHLIVADLTIAIDVVQLKCPIQFILHLASRRDREGADELLEIDGPRFIAVEDVEDVIGEL